MTNRSCLNYLDDTEPVYSSSQTLLSYPSSVIGYNTYYLSTPYKVRKNQMVKVWINFPVAIDTSNDFLVSDYKFYSTSNKINPKYNWRFYIYEIIDQTFYLSYFYFSQQFDLSNGALYELNDLTAKFNNSDVNVTRTVNITNCKK